MKRAHQLYADAVSALLKLVAEQMDMPATDEQRLDCIGKMTDTFSLVRNYQLFLVACPLLIL